MFSKHILILLLFLTIVLVISELMNLLDEYTSDFSIKTLSIKDLQHILKYRGIGYKGLVEKNELINLLQETGQTNKYELYQAKRYIGNEGKCNQTTISVIPNEDLFNELVEDSKDSAWILMTILPKSAELFPDEHRKILETVWCHVQSTYIKFGVNMAVLDCGYLYNLCWDRGFHRSPFVLVLPRGRVKVKDSVDFFVFPYPKNMIHESVESMKKSVNDWLRTKMAHHVNQEVAIEGFQEQKAKLSNNFPAHFVSIYTNKSGMRQMPPISISAHSVRFTGRINFWSGTINNIPISFRDNISQKFPNWNPPGHFFISKSNLIYQYGLKKGQSISFDALELFFRDMCPSSNDIFIWILIAINLLISFQIALQNGSLALRLGYFIWYFLVFNIFYCLIFISLLSSLNLTRNANGLLRFLFRIWQKIAISDLFDHIRFLQLCNKLNLNLCSIVWLLLTVVIGFKYRSTRIHESDSNGGSDLRESSSTIGIVDGTANHINNNSSNINFMEPWDPEAGHQIALLTSLGNINLTLQQQPPLYLSKLLIWSFQAPQKWAANLANKCKDSKMASKITTTLYETNKMTTTMTTTTGCHDDSDLSATDFSSGGDMKDSHLSSGDGRGEVKWPRGYIFTNHCCICLERFQQNETLCGLPCRHAFHNDCIKKWLVQRAKDDCPQCRWPAYKEKP